MSSILKPVLGSQLQLGHPLARGLAGLWLFNEGSGTIAQDLSGNGKVGIVTGAASEISWQAGPEGEGSVVDFVGDTQAGFVFPQITFQATSRWTIIIKLQTDGDGIESIPLGVYGTSTDYFWFREGNYIRFRSNGTSADFTSVQTFTSWSTYTFVSIGDGNLSLYVDGVFKETIGSIGSSFDLTCIGNGMNNDGYTLDGRVSFCYAWNNRALSASEIAQLYREPFCMFERDPIELWSAATIGAAPVGMAGAMTTNTGYWGY